MKHILTILTMLTLAAAARADFVTELWGNDPACHHRDCFKADGTVGEFDLSAMPAGAAIQRAVLKVKIQRQGYASTIEINPVAKGADSAQGAKALPLRGPFYRDFDATSAVRAALADKSPLRLEFKAAPGWNSKPPVLEIAYVAPGAAKEPTPKVSAVKAVYHDGQTFLTWKEHQDIMAGDDPVTLEKMEAKLVPLKGKSEFMYRVYAHSKPITADTIAEATLLAEVPFVLSAYYLDSVPTIEHPKPEKGEGSSPLVAGPRARRAPVSRYVIAKDEMPLASGTGLYVRTITLHGKTYYAVVTAVNGREAAGKDDLSEQNSLKAPVAEELAPPIPVMQASTIVKNENNKKAKGWYVCTYNYWLEFPYANIPRQLAVGTRQNLDLPEGTKGVLWVQLGAYGSQSAFNAFQRGGGDVTICPPWDMDDAILQGRHECIETLKSYDQGVVHCWAQRRTLALVEWARRAFPVDPERTVLEGQFPLWALRHGDVFAVVMGDAYGNFNKGKEAQKHGQFWGPYPKGAKNVAGPDQWDWMNLAKWIRENPQAELPYYVSRPTGSSHVGDIGPWAWAELFAALRDTKRAFCARWGGPWAGTPTAGTVMLSKITLHQSLPAFTNCSLDGCPGDGELNPAGVGGDGDPVADINSFLVWDTDKIVDEFDKWEMTVWLYEGDKDGRGKCPVANCTVNLTPRRGQKFKPALGETFTWTNTSLADGKVVQTGAATADKNGLVTAENLVVTMGKNRIAFVKKG